MSADTIERPETADALNSAKRRQILHGARQVFLAQGFDAAGMGEIARAAGVSKGMLYVYFENKEELFAALVKRQCAITAEKLFELDADSRDVRTALTRLGISFISAVVETSHVQTVRMVIGAAERMPKIGQLFLDAGPRAGAKRLSRWLRAKVEHGELEIGDIELAAWRFIASCEGAVMTVLIGGEAPPSPERIAYLVDGAVDIFLAAYGPKAARP